MKDRKRIAAAAISLTVFTLSACFFARGDEAQELYADQYLSETQEYEWNQETYEIDGAAEDNSALQFQENDLLTDIDEEGDSVELLEDDSEDIPEDIVSEDEWLLESITEADDIEEETLIVEETEEMTEAENDLAYPLYEEGEAWFTDYSGGIDTNKFSVLYKKTSGTSKNPNMKIVCTDSGVATFFVYYSGSFTIPDRVNIDMTEWEKYVQYKEGVKYLHIGGSGEQSYQSSVTSITVGKQAFTYLNKLEKVYFPLPVTKTLTIGEEAFSGLDNLKTVDFAPIKKIIIEDMAFLGTALREISLPEDTTVGSRAFAYLEGRTNDDPLKFYFLGNPENIEPDAFFETSVVVYVQPKYREWVENNKDLINEICGGRVKWNYFSLDQVCGNNLTWTLDEETGVLRVNGNGRMFDYSESMPAPWSGSKSKIQEIIIGPEVSYVGDYAFYQCTGCKRITLGENTLAVGLSAFYGCTGCEEITLGANTQSVGSSAFYNCTSCKKITLGENTQTIGNSAFYKCKSCTELYLGSNLISIGDSAFYDIGNWERLDFPVTLVSIGAYAFRSYSQSGTKPILHITFRGTVPSIGSLAFGNRDVVMVVPFSDGAWQKKTTSTSWASATIKKWLDLNYTDFCGDYAKWIIQDDVMTISGMGTIRRGWTDGQIADVREIHIEDGITYIQEGTFTGFKNLETIYITDDIKRSHSGAFGDCYPKLTRIVGTKGPEEIERSYYVIQEPAGTYFLLYPRTLDAEESSIEYHIPDGVNYVDVNLFCGDRTINTVSVPKMTSLTCYQEIPSDAYYPTFLCYTDSRAHIFCEYNGLPYQLIDEETISSGAGWRLEQIAFSFSNSSEDFEYGKEYSIPLTQYQSMFGDKGENDLSHVLWKSHGIWGGSCFGMSAASLLFRQWIRSADSPFGKTKNVSDLGIYSMYKSNDINVRSMIEQMQVMQYSEQIQDSYYVHMNDMEGLRAEAEQLKDPKASGTPILIAISGKNPATGRLMDHVVVGYYLSPQGSNKMRLYVYDSNYSYLTTSNKRYITLTKNEDGELTGWSYNIYGNVMWGSDVQGGRISYVTYDTLLEVWRNRGNLRNKKSLIKINSRDFELRDEDDNVIATVKDGKLSTDRTDIYLAMLMENIEIEDDHTYIYVPADEVYTAQSNDTQNGLLKVTIVNTYGSVTITTEGNTVTLGADDDTMQYVGTVDALNGEAYRISINGAVTQNGFLPDDPVDTADDASGKDVKGNTPSGTDSGTKGNSADGSANTPSDSSGSEKPFILVNAKNVPLKKGQSTKGLIVSMAKGDRIVSVKSNKKKIVKAAIADAEYGRIKLKGKKPGKAKVTITLASGCSEEVKVTVQKKAVKTKKITVGSSTGDAAYIPADAKNVSLKKGEKVNIGAVVQPFTSLQKLKFTSSKKSVATVSNKGIITAKKAGSTRITVRSGSKKIIITVTVR